MPEPDDRERLKALERRIAAAKGGKETSTVAEHHSQAQLGWRMVIELVSGLLVGFAIGYGLDSLFGTLPVLMVIFTLLGFVAGVRVMLRSAAEFQKRSEDGAKEEG
ncbi:MAG: AtpZ/AtpI family protein [Rubellimicrobium sp.]|nr:AtpZ/AtpI family protein [Rubellimicrobium sp.]